MKSSLFTEVGYASVNKYGEQLCGDHVEITSGKDDGSTIVVLADGLGSGVKANILSTLTATIISTMLANSLSVDECVSAIAATLPVCKTRQIAYSTFSVIRLTDNSEAELIQYDNPQIVLLRDGKNCEYESIVEQIEQKKILRSRIKLCEGDAFVVFSDGALHAGTGMSLNFGWQRDQIIKYLEENYSSEYTAKVLSTLLLDQCNTLYGGEPGDDTTVCAVKIRRRRSVNLVIGPPVDPADDRKMMSLFFAKEGKHIVCGGTTSKLAARFLDQPLDVSAPLYPDAEIPPIAKIEGVDLVTEGIVTISRVLDYAKDYLDKNELYYLWSCQEDGASLISKILFEEATDICFFVGRAVNPAHQNSNISINFNIKMRLVDELAECLTKMGKKIKVSYF